MDTADAGVSSLVETDLHFALSREQTTGSQALAGRDLASVAEESPPLCRLRASGLSYCSMSKVGFESGFRGSGDHLQSLLDC